MRKRHNMKLYRFSPIVSEKRLIEAVKYVANQTTRLSRKIIGKELPISSLTVFSHYKKEHENLVKIVYGLGKLYKEHNGPYIVLKKPIKVGNNLIKYLRIRKPDPYRVQVGCNDFDVQNYQSFKTKHLQKNTENLRLLDRPEYEMVEFFHPDFDVLAYVVSKGI